MQYNIWLAKPYGLANQKLCYIQIYRKRQGMNVLENGWWIRALDHNLTLGTLTLSLPLTMQESFVDSADQDQTSQNKQSNILTTLSTLLL